MRWIVLLVIVAAIACGHSQKKGDGTGDGAGTGAAAGSSGAARADQPITRDDCLKMIDHVLGLLVEYRKQTKPEQPFTQEDVDNARKKMIKERMDGCLAFDRPTWQCVMAATTVEAAGTCAEGPPPPK